MCFTLVSSSLISSIDCEDHDKKPPLIPAKKRFNDVSQAINYMYERLPDDMSMEEKCKRYAVLSLKSLSEKRPYETTVSNVVTMDKNNLDRHYRTIDINRLSGLYMSAIDRYRITQLAPPFIDLVECLSQIDTTAVRSYLTNWELVVILDLYKQVLGLPGVISLHSLDITNFHSAFWSTLRNLFKQYLNIDRIFSGTVLKQIKNSMDPPEAIVGTSLSDVEDQRYRKQQFLNRRREQSRLAQQRLRILNQDKREKNRLHQQERREREKQIYRSHDSPVVDEIRRRAQERRGRASERRIQRHKRLKEQFEHQQRLLALTHERIKQQRLQQALLQEQGRLGGEHESKEQQTIPAPDLQQIPTPTPMAPIAPTSQMPEFRPLVKPMTPFPGFSQSFDLQSTYSPALSPPIPSLELAGQKIDNEREFGDLLTAWPFEPVQAGTYREQTTYPTEFDDTDAVLQMLLDQPDVNIRISSPSSPNKGIQPNVSTPHS